MALPNTDLNPQNGVQGTSYLYNFGTSPNTRAAISQKTRVLTPTYGNSKVLSQMGVLTSIGSSSNRSAESIRGLGFGDRIAEVIPGYGDMETLSFERAMLFLCNLWQATGYAGGIDGPARSLKHHRWPFDTEVQLVLSQLADYDLGVANQGLKGVPGQFNGGVRQISYPQVTQNQGQEAGSFSQAPGNSRGVSAIITMYEACWFTSYTYSFNRDTSMIMEGGEAAVSDVHDFASVYGEFLATGNDPTIGQLGSIRFGSGAQAGSGIGGGGTVSPFVNQAGN